MSGTRLDHDHGDLPNEGRYRHRDADFDERLTSNLVERGYAVLDGFLGTEQARALYEFETESWRRGTFRAAGVSRVASRVEDQRRDFIRWLDDGDERREPHSAFFSKLDAWKEPLRETLRLALGRWEFHASVYPPGAFYRRHVDTFADSKLGPRRLLSFVYYLNPAWGAADGGEIALWEEGRELPRLVLPCEDRLLVFDSSRVPHEVRAPVDRERFAITGWWLSR